MSYTWRPGDRRSPQVPTPEQLAPPGPQPWRCFDLGRQLAADAHRLAMAESRSSRRRAGRTPSSGENELLPSEREEDRKYLRALRDGDHAFWRDKTTADLEATGTRSCSIWHILLARDVRAGPHRRRGAVHGLWITNADKAFAVFARERSGPPILRLHRARQPGDEEVIGVVPDARRLTSIARSRGLRCLATWRATTPQGRAALLHASPTPTTRARRSSARWWRAENGSPRCGRAGERDRRAGDLPALRGCRPRDSRRGLGAAPEMPGGPDVRCLGSAALQPVGGGRGIGRTPGHPAW